MDTLLDLLNKFEALGSREALIGFNDFRTWRLSYRETYEAIGRFAALLDSKGLRKGDRVLIWGENRPEWVIAFWGCVARGVAIVPIDYRFSTELVARICAESKARLVLTGYSVDATQIPIRAVSFSEIRKLPPASALRTTRIEPDDIVEIVYTSGTTAEPKGVVHRHRNMAANLEPFRTEIEKYLKWGRPFQPIRVLDLLPLSHMFGQALGLFIPVLLGGSVAFTEELNPGAIIRSVKRQRISVLASVPHVIDNLRNEIERQFELPPAPAGTGLKGAARRWWRYRRVHAAFGWKFWCVVSGGAFVAPELEGFWQRLGFVFVQGYGLTETSPVIAVNHPFRARRGSIGKAIRGQEIRIAADGEILVRGQSVVGAVDPEGWFHTGDVGEMDQEGQLYFKGRKKDVIVTADGMNVYPEDVETVLNELPQVRASVVVSEDDHVHAALILRESAASVKSIIDQANRRLEPYQQIRGWSLWPAEDFPRTPSTLKVRRGEVARLIARGVEPETEPKGLPDDLTALSSLDRVDLLASLEQRYGVELNEESFAQIRTTEELQAWVEEQAGHSVPSVKERSTPWAANRVVRFVGDGLQRAIALPLFRHYIPLEVRGLENLKGVRPPIIFASNHTSHLDTPAIFAALPAFWRKRLAPAARQEQFRAFFDQQSATWKEFFVAISQYRLAGLLFNVYPLPQQMSGVRRALRTTGDLVNRGFCPLIFPEGIRTEDGEMHGFQPGVGLMAVRLRVPVVPVFIRGLFEVYSVHDSWPKPGPVRVSFGRALEFPQDVGYAEAAARVEEAVRCLAASA